MLTLIHKAAQRPKIANFIILMIVCTEEASYELQLLTICAVIFYKQNTFLHNYLKICTTHATKNFFCQCEGLSIPAIFSVFLLGKSDYGIKYRRGKSHEICYTVELLTCLCTTVICYMIRIPVNHSDIIF